MDSVRISVKISQSWTPPFLPKLSPHLIQDSGCSTRDEDDRGGHDKQLHQRQPQAPGGLSIMCQVQAGTQDPYHIVYVVALGSTLPQREGGIDTKVHASPTAIRLALPHVQQL